MATTTDTIRTQFVVAGHQNVVSAMGRIAGAAATMSSVAATAGALAAGGVVALGVAAVKTAGDFEMLRARLDSVYRSAAAGKKAFDWAVQFAKETPFKLREVVDAMSTMKAMGLDPMRDLRTIGDTAGALGLGADGIRRITMQLGQMKAIGRVSMEDLRVLAEAGVPVFSILQQEMGLTNEQLKRIGDLGLDADSAINALLNGMDKAFGGGMAKMMATINGKIVNLEDEWEKFKAAIGKALAPTVMVYLNRITAWFSDKSNIDKALTFASYITAGFKTAEQVVRDLMNMLFNKSAPPRWLDQIVADLADIAQMFFGVVAASKALDAAAAGFDLNPAKAIKLSLEAGAATVAAGMAKGIKEGADKRLATGDKSTPTLRGLKADFLSNQQSELFRMRKAANIDAISLLVDGANARPDSAPSPSKAGNGLQGLVEQIILGGGSRAAGGVKAMDVGRRLLGGTTPVVEIRVKSDDGSKLGQAVADIAQKSASDLIEQISRDPRLRQQFKAALAQ